MARKASKKYPEIRVYHGYGNGTRMVVFGHVLRRTARPRNRYTPNYWHNTLDMLRLFMVMPVETTTVRLTWQNQVLETSTEKDGFFRFEWETEVKVEPGWHSVHIATVEGHQVRANETTGRVFVPGTTQFGFISDIDDTVMISHSARVGRRLKEILTRHPQSRRHFPEVCRHYQMLAISHTRANTPNPFFYVSSSEWNLFGYLSEFFSFNGFPEGIFLLNQLKQWHQIFRTGKTNHMGKLYRVQSVLEAFPAHRFVLMGDNSQADPTIYQAVVDKYPAQVVAVYIRNVRKKREVETRIQLSKMATAGVEICLYSHSEEAIAHSRSIGLIDAHAEEAVSRMPYFGDGFP